MTELALGLAAFAAVALFAIHFGEVGFAALKVHEAGASAIWDATAYRVERVGVDGEDDFAWYDSARAAPRAQSIANRRYRDWDGRASQEAAEGPTQVTARGMELDVRCARTDAAGVGFPIQATARTPSYGEPGSLGCGARASVEILNLPEKFFEQAAFRNARGGSKLSYTFCAFGRSDGDSCPGTANILLGDHGLTSGNNENAECERRTADDGISTCGNRAFYRLAHEAWDRSKGWSGLPEDFAEDVTGSVPKGRITGFYMSFRGRGSGFHEPGEQWQSSPMDFAPGGTYRQALIKRGPAGTFKYLGKFGCD